MDGQTDRGVDKWTLGHLNKWMDGRTDGWSRGMTGWRDGQTDGRDGWDRGEDRQTDRQDRGMDGGPPAPHTPHQPGLLPRLPGTHGATALPAPGLMSLCHRRALTGVPSHVPVPPPVSPVTSPCCGRAHSPAVTAVPRHIPSWKGPTGLTEPNPWHRTDLPKILRAEPKRCLNSALVPCPHPWGSCSHS